MLPMQVMTSLLRDDIADLDGGFTGQEALYLGVDQNKANDFIQITITFLYSPGVNNVNFSVFDVDDGTGQWVDELYRFRGRLGGTTVSNATLTDSIYNNVANSGATNATATGVTANADNNTGDGNVGVNFGTPTVTSIDFRWRNTDGALGFQHIALSDITYTVVPEPATVFTASLLGLLVLGQGIRRKMKRLPFPSGV
jgi:hypothetical protein